MSDGDDVIAAVAVNDGAEGGGLHSVCLHSSISPESTVFHFSFFSLLMTHKLYPISD